MPQRVTVVVVSPTLPLRGGASPSPEERRGKAPPRGGPLFHFDYYLSKYRPDEDNLLLVCVTVGRFDSEIGFKNFDDSDFMSVVWSVYEVWKQRRLPLSVSTAERFMSAVCDECGREGIEYPRGWLKVLRELREEMSEEGMAGA